MYRVYFNGIPMPSFVKVHNVDFVDLSLPVSGKPTEKTFTLTVSLVDKAKSIHEMARELSMWLRGDNFALSPLSFSDNEDVTYMAAVKTAPVIKDLLYLGQTVIEFSVPSGAGFGKTKAVAGTNAAQIAVDNEGTVPTFPVIQVTPTNTNSAQVPFTITDSVTGRVIRLKGPIKAGEVITIDCNKKVVKRGNKVDMLLIQYNSDWLKFDRAAHVITVDLPCKINVAYTERY